MYAFESCPRRGMLHLLTVGCFVLALLLMGISGVDNIAYPMLYQLTAVILVVIGVYLVIRYVLRLYRYEVSENGITNACGERQYDLVITEITGKRQQIVTRVALRDIAAVAFIDRKKEKQKAVDFIGGVKRVFRYTNSPFEAGGCYLSVPEEGSVLIIPRDEKMMKLLSHYVAGNGEITKTEGEEV